MTTCSTIKEALYIKKKIEDYHREFRMPFEEVVIFEEKCCLFEDKDSTIGLEGFLSLSQHFGCWRSSDKKNHDTKVLVVKYCDLLLKIVIPFKKTFGVEKHFNPSLKCGILTILAQRQHVTPVSFF
jgi:hypothetical protein